MSGRCARCTYPLSKARLPRQLSCGHSFCSECVRHFLEAGTPQNVPDVQRLGVASSFSATGAGRAQSAVAAVCPVDGVPLRYLRVEDFPVDFVALSASQDFTWEGSTGAAGSGPVGSVEDHITSSAAPQLYTLSSSAADQATSAPCEYFDPQQNRYCGKQSIRKCQQCRVALCSLHAKMPSGKHDAVTHTMVSLAEFTSISPGLFQSAPPNPMHAMAKYNTASLQQAEQAYQCGSPVALFDQCFFCTKVRKFRCVCGMVLCEAHGLHHMSSVKGAKPHALQILPSIPYNAAEAVMKAGLDTPSLGLQYACSRCGDAASMTCQAADCGLYLCTSDSVEHSHTSRFTPANQESDLSQQDGSSTSEAHLATNPAPQSSETHNTIAAITELFKAKLTPAPDALCQVCSSAATCTCKCGAQLCQRDSIRHMLGVYLQANAASSSPLRAQANAVTTAVDSQLKSLGLDPMSYNLTPNLPGSALGSSALARVADLMGHKLRDITGVTICHDCRGPAGWSCSCGSALCPRHALPHFAISAISAAKGLGPGGAGHSLTPVQRPAHAQDPPLPPMGVPLSPAELAKLVATVFTGNPDGVLAPPAPLERMTCFECGKDYKYDCASCGFKLCTTHAANHARGEPSHHLQARPALDGPPMTLKMKQQNAGILTLVRLLTEKPEAILQAPALIRTLLRLIADPESLGISPPPASSNASIESFVSTLIQSSVQGPSGASFAQTLTSILPLAVAASNASQMTDQLQRERAAREKLLRAALGESLDVNEQSSAAAHDAESASPAWQLVDVLIPLISQMAAVAAPQPVGGLYLGRALGSAQSSCAMCRRRGVCACKHCGGLAFCQLHGAEHGFTCQGHELVSIGATGGVILADMKDASVSTSPGSLFSSNGWIIKSLGPGVCCDCFTDLDTDEALVTAAAAGDIGPVKLIQPFVGLPGIAGSRSVHAGTSFECLTCGHGTSFCTSDAETHKRQFPAHKLYSLQHQLEIAKRYVQHYHSWQGSLPSQTAPSLTSLTNSSHESFLQLLGCDMDRMRSTGAPTQVSQALIATVAQVATSLASTGHGQTSEAQSVLAAAANAAVAAIYPSNASEALLDVSSSQSHVVHSASVETSLARVRNAQATIVRGVFEVTSGNEHATAAVANVFGLQACDICILEGQTMCQASTQTCEFGYRLCAEHAAHHARIGQHRVSPLPPKYGRSPPSISVPLAGRPFAPQSHTSAMAHPFKSSGLSKLTQALADATNKSSISASRTAAGAAAQALIGSVRACRIHPDQRYAYFDEVTKQLYCETCKAEMDAQRSGSLKRLEDALSVVKAQVTQMHRVLSARHDELAALSELVCDVARTQGELYRQDEYKIRRVFERLRGALQAVENTTMQQHAALHANRLSTAATAVAAVESARQNLLSTLLTSQTLANATAESPSVCAAAELALLRSANALVEATRDLAATGPVGTYERILGLPKDTFSAASQSPLAAAVVVQRARSRAPMSPHYASPMPADRELQTIQQSGQSPGEALAEAAARSGANRLPKLELNERDALMALAGIARWIGGTAENRDCLALESRISAFAHAPDGMSELDSPSRPTSVPRAIGSPLTRGGASFISPSAPTTWPNTGTSSQGTRSLLDDDRPITPMLSGSYLHNLRSSLDGGSAKATSAERYSNFSKYTF